MFDFIRTYQLDIMLALSAACLSFVVLLFFTQSLDKRRKTILIYMELSATLLLLFDRQAYLYSGVLTKTGYIMVRVSNFLVFFMTTAVILIFNYYIINLIKDYDKSYKIPKRLQFVTIGCLIQLLLVVASQFNDFIYYIDENNIYHRGKGFLLCYILPVVCPFIQYSVIVRFKRFFSKLIYTSLILYITVPITVALIQIFTYGISIVNMSLVAVSISLYIFAYLDINRTVARAHQIEIGKLKEDELRMKRLFNQTANSFVKAMEQKGIYEKGYIFNLANLARAIAEGAGNEPDKCDEVYYAALLYNVGTLCLPDVVILNKNAPSPADELLIKEIPILSSNILSGIDEYPFLKNAAKYCHENYDGSGYPDGLKGNNIPQAARIIAVAESYIKMTGSGDDEEALPYIIMREEFIKNAGIIYDPIYANIMIHLMDKENLIKADKSVRETEIKCKLYKEKVSTGIELTDMITIIQFEAEPMEHEEGEFSTPSIIVFDSYDMHHHTNPRAVKAYRYQEYAEIWPDGKYVSTSARNMEVKVIEHKNRSEYDAFGMYEITASKYDDHIKIEMTNSCCTVSAIISLYDNSKSAYIGLTGENCYIKNIAYKKTDTRIDSLSIAKISDSLIYTDRLESDIPNIQIDKTRSAYTKSVLIDEEFRIDFHSLSLPSSNLVWHCPYVVIFYSDDGKVFGEGYKEYTLIKLNGEISGNSSFADNNFNMKKKESFPGWDKWREINKEGLEYSVLFMKRGNKVETVTETLGISIDNTTILRDHNDKVYVALTGDEVALTDIRIVR